MIGGVERLIEQAIDWVDGEISWRWDDETRGSPIERLFQLTMTTYCMLQACEFHSFIELDGDRIDPGDDADQLGLYFKREVQFDFGRVDFVIFAFDAQHPRNRWRRLIVECDGHNYHERTKGQAARDRSRDREASLQGIDFFRFTGSELWRDPWECARQVHSWAVKGWF